MPTVNIYYSNLDLHHEVVQLGESLPHFLSTLLSGPTISLKSNEITTRGIRVESGVMIGNIEIEITAHSFKERVEKQDEICRTIRDYLMKNYPRCGDVRVWLTLSELGHSW